MNQKTKLEQVVDFLKEKGYTDDQIAATTEEIAHAGFNQLYSQAMATFTDEDMVAIADCPEEEVQQEVLKRFSAQTGRDANQVMQEFLDTFAVAFLEQAQKTETPPASSQSE